MKKSLPLMAAAFLATFAFSPLSHATRLTIANTTQAGTPMSQTMSAFKQRVEELSGNKIEVQTSFGGALGNDTQLLQKAQIGSQLQAAQTSGANLGPVVNAFKIFDVPFLLSTPQQSVALFYPDGKLAGPVVDKLQLFLGKKNLRLLYATPFEFRGILTSSKKIQSPADLKGMKFRVTPNPVERAIVGSWGAAGTSMGISEVYTSLQTGIVDGLAIPPVTAQGFALNEVAKSFVNLNFQAHPTFVVVNKKFWDKLPVEEQKLIQQAADEAVMQTKQVHYDAVAASLAAFQKSGAEVTTPAGDALMAYREPAVKAGEALIATELKPDEQALLKEIQAASSIQ
ncbi:TRAP transporter substrate-binding protein [Escherichia fergusonii]|nr:TRAP transporter substrate-binding protein [Escherichia fergusonii]